MCLGLVVRRDTICKPANNQMREERLSLQCAENKCSYLLGVHQYYHQTNGLAPKGAVEKSSISLL